MKDIIGVKYNRLTIKEILGKKNGHVIVRCECECGNEKITRYSRLENGSTKSCGCLRIETTKEMRDNNITHGNSKSRLYRCWQGMKQRCNGTSNIKSKERYLERNIGICEEWKNSFETFKEWAVNNGYSDYLTLDRIDVNDGYYPYNCRWADAKTQANNKESTPKVMINGEYLLLEEISEKYGIKLSTVRSRYRRGFTPDDIIRKTKEAKEYEYNGESHTLREWSNIVGISISTLQGRILERGWNIERALQEAPKKSHDR